MVVLITGTSSGLGKALAEILISKGYRVWGTMRRIPADSNFSFNVIEMDVCRPESIENAIKSIIDKEGKIDFLINNAGVGLATPLESASWDKINLLYETNVFGVIHTIQQVLPYMRKSGYGRILNISSIGSEVSLPFRGLYCSTKSAINRLTESLRMEVRDFDFNCTSILAGDMATSINDNRLTETENIHQIYKKSFEKVHRHIHSEVEKGVSAMYAASKILKIMELNSWKPDYALGHRMQKISLLLRRILPKNLFEKIIFKYSGL
jgi:short-subunit dehydrogenase